ncbi:BRCA2-interacting transcriptional repressor EMSY-like isoform X2 [Homarus americanus]|uniref:BRCA2-interacting transcriptional repressor EMSY-like isoform X2 n=1 Tax=Homarus americanus TaxID=6706 RepID=UPI001C458BE1|nr:BRCA2-interacting transcriptional repressor EMSY-like isoform X2 [Homarus americanus]
MMDIGNKVPNKWPKLLDMTKDECRKALRALELTTYSQVVSVLRAQGELTKEKRKLLNDLQTIFSITLERHRAEIRRAVNDEKLNTIADILAGPNTGVEWAVEGRRLVPLMPRIPPQTSYTAIATRMALLYYGINAKMPSPDSTAMFGKMDDLGAESDDTDSEEETEGLRFIQGAMVPQQYNNDQGSYTTLPLSQTRLSKLPPKENRENRETPTTTSGGSIGPMSLGFGTGSGGVCGSSDKRKRKRSSSTEHPPLPPPPPPPPAPRELPPAPGTPSKQISGISRPMPGPPMKITVTGNVARGTPGTPVSTLGGHTQKVILVSTSGASGVGSGMYQRSLSVPVMKGSAGAAPTVMRGVPSAGGTMPGSQMQPGLKTPALMLTTTTTTPPPMQDDGQSDPYVSAVLRRRHKNGGSVGSGSMIVPSTYSGSGSLVSGGMPPSGTYVNRMRPRVPTGALPPRPRQRSNSLVLQAEAGIPQRGVESGAGAGGNSMISGSHMSTMPSFSGNSSNIVAPSTGSHGMPPGHMMTHQTIQVRPGTPATPGKAAIQIRQEGTGAKIITHSVGGSGGGIGGSTSNPSSVGSSSNVGIGHNAPGRLMGRTPLLPPNSPQGTGGPLYVVTTNSGTITVVTRTVAAGQGSGPRVVTVNTINAPKASISGVRTPAPATVVSVGSKTIQTVRVTPQGPAGLRPVLGGTKSNVIVVHKGAPSPGTRPMNIQGIRDVPTKITIGKTLSGSSSSTVLQKPLPLPRGTIAAPSVVPVSTPTSQGNVIVVDLSPEGSSVSNNNALADILQATGILGAIGPSSVDSGNIPAGGGGGEVGSNEGETPRIPPSSSSVSSLSRTETTSTSMETATQSSITTHSRPISESSSSITNSGSTTSNVSTTASTTTTATNTSTTTLANTVTNTTTSSSAITTPTASSSSSSGSSSEGTGGTGGSGSGCAGDGDGEWLNLGLEGEDSPGHSLPEGQMQMLEEAVEILGRGDKESARNLLRQAGIELLDSPGDIGEQGGEATSMASLMAGLASQLPVAHLDDGSLAPVGELDPATGLFYNPSSTESSSDTNSNSASEEMEAPEERESPE